jgi:toxin ParE1/3/4
MRVRYTPIAVADLHALASYALKHLDEGAVEVLVETLREAIEVLIVQFPDVGRPGRVRGTRELVLTRINLMVTYRVEKATIAVLTILRGERDRKI